MLGESELKGKIYLHDLEEGISDDLEVCEGHALLVRAGAGKRPIQQAMPAVRPECGHGCRLHLADAKQQVELGQRELVQAKPQNSLRVCIGQQHGSDEGHSDLNLIKTLSQKCHYHILLSSGRSNSN